MNHEIFTWLFWKQTDFLPKIPKSVFSKPTKLQRTSKKIEKVKEFQNLREHRIWRWVFKKINEICLYLNWSCSKPIKERENHLLNGRTFLGESTCLLNWSRSSFSRIGFWNPSWGSLCVLFILVILFNIKVIRRDQIIRKYQKRTLFKVFKLTQSEVNLRTLAFSPCLLIPRKWTDSLSMNPLLPPTHQSY